MKTALVCGAGGFIGHPLVERLVQEGYRVTGVDLKVPEFSETHADEFKIRKRSARSGQRSAESNGEGELSGQPYSRSTRCSVLFWFEADG